VQWPAEAKGARFVSRFEAAPCLSSFKRILGSSVNGYNFFSLCLLKGRGIPRKRGFLVNRLERGLVLDEDPL